MDANNHALSERYEHLWNSALPAIRNGAIEIDPTLAKWIPDQRRGFTLIARPNLETQQHVQKFIDALKAIDPEQYYYPPNSLHVTVLSLFTATEAHERFSRRRKEYEAAVASAVAGTPSFEIQFNGITASPGAVMIQGFPRGEVLERLRECLRRTLQNPNLSDELDTRYRLITAHMTAVRFRAPLGDSHQYAEKLKAFRETTFGSSHIEILSLVQNDWYMSPQNLELLSDYPLD
ncbi:MAG TPA: 2'-5' RNA ligase family protein [Verrucomicrobiae bacterium]|nr:2'-5' RNA ligase family protein [Verrucomicrobiae bacterium]